MTKCNTLGAGGFVFVPHGTPFAFRCLSETVKVLVQATAADGDPVVADRFLAEMVQFGIIIKQAEYPDPSTIQQELIRIATKTHVAAVAPADIRRLMPHYLLPAGGPSH